MSNWVWPLLFVVMMGLLVGGGIAIPMWYLSSRWSGWSALERDYRATAPWKGPRWRSTSASMGGGPRLFMGIHTGTGLAPNHPMGARYGGLVAVGADDSGFHLSALIRLWHPPLLIPWDHVQMEVPAGGRDTLPHPDLHRPRSRRGSVTTGAPRQPDRTADAEVQGLTLSRPSPGCSPDSTDQPDTSA